MNKPPEIALTVLITVVSGKKSLHQCLTVLCPQINFEDAEVIVPFDKFSNEIGELAPEFPKVNFHYVENLGIAESVQISAHQHRLYDRRRAAGLQRARGRIIAMTEDHAQPAADWVRQIFAAHERKCEVIGGAIENGIDYPLNWAWYYCDFGRYGRPLPKGSVGYVSDVNVAYKRSALESVREVWQEAYRETILHWALRDRGTELFLDERMVVYQHRPRISANAAFSERIAWGRVFAETRVIVCSAWQRFVYAVGAMFLPPLLLVRLIKNMRRQNRTLRQIAAVIPWALLLLIGWSLGEMLGYISGSPKTKAGSPNAAETTFASN